MKNVVVMGGAFNPPTVAHGRLLGAAMDAAQAQLGIWLPASSEYVRRKLGAGREHELMSDGLRLALVRAAASEDGRQTVEDYELRGAGTGYTVETLEAVAAAHPGAQLFFLIGSDKLRTLPGWHRADELLSLARLLVVRRGGEDPEELLRENPFLAARRERFGVVAFPSGMEHVSSSAVRRLLREGDPRARDMLPEAVWALLRGQDK